MKIETKPAHTPCEERTYAITFEDGNKTVVLAYDEDQAKRKAYKIGGIVQWVECLSHVENKKVETTHTPTPWKVMGNANAGYTIRDAEGECVANLLWEGTEEDEANAAFIVRAVNAFDKHLELIRRADRYIRMNENAIGQDHGTFCDYCQAIAQASGEK